MEKAAMSAFAPVFLGHLALFQDGEISEVAKPLLLRQVRPHLHSFHFMDF